MNTGDSQILREINTDWELVSPPSLILLRSSSHNGQLICLAAGNSGGTTKMRDDARTNLQSL